MERKKYTTTLSQDVLSKLELICILEKVNGKNAAIEVLVNKYWEDNKERLINEINKNTK